MPSTTSAPKQARSQASFCRMLDAAEALLADRDFDSLTIADVVRRAKTSVGVFYSRFPDKNALLDALYERHQQEVVQALEHQESGHAQFESVTQLVRERVHRIITLYRTRRGLMRTLVLRGYQRPDWRYTDPSERRRLSLAQFGRLLHKHRAEIGHPDPVRAGAFAMLMVLSTLREKLLFGESTASGLDLTGDQLEDELVSAVLAYLRVQPQEPRP